MAFKNLLTPNVAAGSAFNKAHSGFGPNNPVGLANSTEQECELGSCLQIQCPGLKDGEGCFTYDTQINSNSDITVQHEIFAPTNVPMQMILVDSVTWTTTYTKQFNGKGEWSNISVSGNIPSNRFETYITVDSGHISPLNFYVGRGQAEYGLVPTMWQFPGVDLTGNSIPSNEAFGNIKLENTIQAFGIASQEQIHNLTLENILTLVGITSEEYINNIGLLNEIIVEGIESTTTVKDLLIYVYAKTLKTGIKIKYPQSKTVLTYPHSSIKVTSD